MLFFRCQHLLTTVFRAIRSLHTVPFHLPSSLSTQTLWQARCLMVAPLRREILSCFFEHCSGHQSLVQWLAPCPFYLYAMMGFGRAATF